MTNKKTTTTLATFALALGIGAAAFAADAPQCEVCNMKVDAKHNVQYRYVLEDGKKVPIGSMTCAKKYWAEHKDEKLVFEATDFMSGKWEKADDGFFLIGSKLDLGTGMDKTSVLFFEDEDNAKKAQKANGGKIVPMKMALMHATGDHGHDMKHGHGEHGHDH